MLSILNLLKASLKMNFRNKQAMVFTFIMPVILMILFGLAFGKSGNLSLKVGVVDQANSAFSKEFIKGLEKVDAFKVTKGKKSAEFAALKDGDRTSVIVLPKDFGAGPQKLIDAKKKAAEQAAKMSAMAQAGKTGQAANGAQGAQSNSAAQTQTAGQAMPKFDASKLEIYYDQANPTVTGTAKMVMSQVVSSMNQKASSAPIFFKIAEKQVETRHFSNIDFFAAGILAMFTMNGGVMAVVMIIVGYREQGILRRLKATPMSVSSFMGTQILVRVLIALVQMGILLGLAIVAFGAQVAGSPWLLAAIVVEGSLVFIALGFAIASFSDSNQTAMAIANIITMPMMFLSGVFFPTDSFPKFVQPLIKVLPLTYLANALRDVMMRGEGFTAVSRDMGILAIYGIVIFAVSVKAFKWE